MKDAVKSKGMLGGFGLMILGAYVIINQKDVVGGTGLLSLGLSVLGLRDAQ